MLLAMRKIVLVLLVFAGLLGTSSAEISPDAVAVLYNLSVPESRRLAELYCKTRRIPDENLIALDMPHSADISRESYDKWILKPLRSEFETRGWWKREIDGGGIKVPIRNRIRVLVAMRGVPLRIQAVPKPGPKPGAPPPAAINPQNALEGHDEASVDSELAMFGVESLPTEAALKNSFYQSKKSIVDAAMPFLVLTARIDAPSYATCERMITDAVEAEKTGLWGRAYVDIANKFPQGDQWLESVVKANNLAGIPTVVDRFDDTLPKNYPMTDASLYFGWYDWNVSGPFLNSGFKFRKGAVAMHLHSFSAEQLSDGNKNWSGALLERGAAVTVGNVYEPYLHLTHDFSNLHQSLLAGFSWVEACWMAMPVTSWQAVVLGDPLYRPFSHLDGGGVKLEGDIEFRALRAAIVQWKVNPRERIEQVEKASERMKSGVLAEALGLEFVERKDPKEASKWFRAAKKNYATNQEKLRQDFNLIAIERALGRKDVASHDLLAAQMAYGSIPEAEGLKSWFDLLNPPPDPAENPAVKKP
jgi:uncharacterized protein (TIGR03790 family)